MKRSRRWSFLRMGEERSDPLSGGLGRRLLAWLLAFALLPLIGSNMLGYLESQDIIESLVHRYLGAIAEVEAQHVRDQLNRSLLELQAIAAGNEFLAAGLMRLQGERSGHMAEAADLPAVRAHLTRKRDELLAFEQLYAQYPDGSLAVSTGTLTADVARRDWDVQPPPVFEALDQPGPDGTSRFRLTVPIQGPGERRVGFLGGLMGPAQISRFLEIPEHLAGSIESFVVDATGRPLFVSHPHGPVDYARPLKSPLLGLEAGGFARYVDRHGVPVIGTSVGIDGLPWRFVAEFPVEDALGPLRGLRRISVLLALVFTVVLVITAWFVAGGIVAPVRRLVAATRRLGRGDFDVRVEVELGDEIGELQHAFNEMAGKLAESSRRIRELHHREIERAQQLATVGELASGVAHEIKNPLVGVANGLDLVERRVGTDEEVRPIMREMKRQISRMEEAVRDLLAFARPAEPRLATVSGNRIVERATRLVEPAAEKAGVELRRRLAPGLPPQEADEELLRQAVVNLLMNAVQATGPGGRVTVRTAAREGCICIEVSDTGGGIPPGDLERIFRPFYTTRHAGTGLGLSLTREIVERHGGGLDVESRLGEGTTFTICLPLDPGTGSCGEDDDGREVP